MKLNTKDVEDLMEYINLQSIYITDDYNAEMESEIGKKEVKRYSKLLTKVSKKLAKAKLAEAEVKE
jgi:hypothetical protein